MAIMSFASFGYEGEIIKVEAYLRRGLPIIEIVGLPGSAVKEARERMRAAIANSQLQFPQERILINLSPADKKKEGSGFDLPIALAVLRVSQECNEPIMVIGELELSGCVRPVRGVLGAILSGVSAGIHYFIVPQENHAEACLQNTVQVFGVKTLQEALHYLDTIYHTLLANTDSKKNIKKISKRHPICTAIQWSEPSVADKIAHTGSGGNFEDILGQEHFIRSLLIAAAGGHNLLAYGPPGCGKTLSIQRFAELLPDLDAKTSEETTRIYSIAGLLPHNGGQTVRIVRPPFRMPHQNASLEGMIGGAGKCMPGEISLAHGGVLFLDEATQFKLSVLQTLRTPLETGIVTLSRAGRTSTFPARFQLLMALNSCPCGNLGADEKICTCMPISVEQYWKKLTAPLIDRIDLRIPVFLPEMSINRQKQKKHTTKSLQKCIEAAVILQQNRYKEYCLRKKLQLNTCQYKNAQLHLAIITDICPLTESAAHTLHTLTKAQQLSGRGNHALLKIARTIADIDGDQKIGTAHIEEASFLRKWSPVLPDFLQ